MRALASLLVLAAVVSCDAITSVAVDGADFGGATANAHCDRRFVTDGGRPAAFCQEIVNTLAASQFGDDCRATHEATAGPGLCPREQIIAGCKLDKKNDDGSLVFDWYYDVSDGGAEGGPATFEPPVPTSPTDVARTCADRVRYQEGAELAVP